MIVSQNQIIARAHNPTETLNDVTAHAEMQAITAAANYLGGKYLLSVSCMSPEPCAMCAGALFWSQIPKLSMEQVIHKEVVSIKDTTAPKTELIGG